MDQINSEILRQFEAKGLTINEGIAVDARLVKSASGPISNKEIDEIKEKAREEKARPKENSIKTANPKNSTVTWIQTGPSKTISPTMA
jgi:hypothetical protein